MEWIKKLFSFKKSSASAENNSVAVAGDNFAPITINQGLNESQLTSLQSDIGEIKFKMSEVAAITLSNDSAIRDAVDQQLDAEIDNIHKLITQYKPLTALQLLQSLYERVAPTATGRIRFRIKANMGMCHYILADSDKAAELFLDAYTQCPSDPKAIANKTLALLLTNKINEAYVFARDQLKADHSNEALAGYLIQVSRFIDTVDDPLELIPVDLHDTPTVIVGRIHYLQQRGRVVEWRTLAFRAAQIFSADEHIKRYAAEATISEILEDPQVQHKHSLSIDQRNQLINATGPLKQAWDTWRNGEGERPGPEIIAVVSNLLVAFLILRSYEQLGKLAEQAILKAGSNSELMECVARTVLQSGHLEIAKKALSLTADNPAVRFMRFHYAASRGDSETLAKFSENAIAEFPVNEQCWCRTAQFFASYKVQQKSPTSDQLAAVLEQVANDARGLTLFSQLTAEFGFEDLSRQAYKLACESIQEKSNIAVRMTVAREAAHRQDWSQLKRLLSGYVDTNVESQEFWNLVTAHANSTPVYDDSIQFFSSLPNDLLKLPRVALAYGTVQYNRGELNEAATWFERAFTAEPTDSHAILALAQTYYRQANHAAVEKLILSIDVAKIDGPPIDRIRLAQLMNMNGRSADAIAYAYEVLCENLKIAEVARLYFGLYLSLGNSGVVPSSAKVIPGCWIELQDQDGEKFECFVDDGQKFLNDQVFPISHPLVELTLGLTVGENFQQSRPFGSARKWTVKQIKNKYLHALHVVTSNYDKWFPNDTKLFKFNVSKQSDFEPLLDSIKEKSQSHEEILDGYVRDSLPLQLLAKGLHINVVGVAQVLRRKGRKIITSVGRLEDYKAAMANLEQRNYDGAVLDTYTTWFAACTDMLPLLKLTFRNLIVPRSVVDDLQGMLQENSALLGRSTLSLSWDNGTYYRTEHSPEEQVNLVTYIKERIDIIVANCTVLPVVWTAEPSDAAQAAMQHLGSHFWDPACLAKEKNRVLLSEDMFYRTWAIEALNVECGVWLDAVLNYSVQRNLISPQQRALAIIRLAQAKHSHLFIDRSILHYVYLADDDTALSNFSSVADVIGIKEADWMSHLVVCDEFFSMLWKPGCIATSKAAKATSILLEKLLRYPEHWAIMLEFLRYEASYSLKEYIDSWAIGHLLPYEERIAARKELAAARKPL